MLEKEARLAQLPCESGRSWDGARVSQGLSQIESLTQPGPAKCVHNLVRSSDNPVEQEGQVVFSAFCKWGTEAQKWRVIHPKSRHPGELTVEVIVPRPP